MQAVLQQLPALTSPALTKDTNKNSKQAGDSPAVVQSRIELSQI